MREEGARPHLRPCVGGAEPARDTASVAESSEHRCADLRRDERDLVVEELERASTSASVTGLPRFAARAFCSSSFCETRRQQPLWVAADTEWRARLNLCPANERITLGLAVLASAGLSLYPKPRLWRTWRPVSDANDRATYAALAHVPADGVASTDL